MDGLMTAEEVAEWLGWGYWKIAALARQGQIPRIKIGRRYYFRRETLLAWLEQQEQASQAGAEARQ